MRKKRDWDIEEFTTNQRGPIGGIVLVIAIAIAYVLSLVWPHPTQAETFPPEVLMAIRVSNESQNSTSIRFEGEKGHVLGEDILDPGNSFVLFIPMSECRNVIHVFLNGHAQGQLRNHLCPELDIEERKEIYILNPGEDQDRVVVAGEDRDDMVEFAEHP